MSFFFLVALLRELHFSAFETKCFYFNFNFNFNFPIAKCNTQLHTSCIEDVLKSMGQKR